MTHVILGHCCKDASCVQVCPQNCIHPAPGEDGFASAETLFIDPNSCIDCTACVEACPASAIKPGYALTATELPFAQRNREFFESAPPAPRVRPRPVFGLPLATPAARLTVAVVGSGPAAMYTVRELLRRSTSIRVTVYEQHETFGGLLRRGVSLDHTGVRDMIRLFDVPFGDDRVTVVPDTEIGVDVSVEELRATFDAVVIACGATQPRRLDSATAGDRTHGSANLRQAGNIHQAIDLLVAANSGSPNLRPPTLAGPDCIVVGAGNVAFDAVRWVAKNRDRSAGGQVGQLVVLSRSAPERASFTPSAFYELLELDGVEVTVDDAGALPPAGSDSALLRALSRLNTVDLHDPHAEPAGLRIVLSFGQEATDVAVTDDGGVVITTAAGRTFHAGSAICAAGFTTKVIDGVPLDRRGVVPNRQGQVISAETGEPLDGLYVVGWAKRGASGGVGDNRGCAAETVAQLATDLLATV
ncbi:FAD-dependent oxidoreductase [Rhodococcus sp. D2-41]|uniref:FAD-dependent oxidoreductase n=1 Tax=Speluncibacter jeojiensis TaxID=2710754 RepID=UPI00240EEC3D|nr:FAD-dependent oxidoreductase [Rhodococcus sp. D2-41]MDG3008845.1 FAD-dependent oxidoreductase [Rhodococcus sp. D2-41]